MKHDFVLCTRDVRKGEFIPEPGKSRYLLVPQNSLPQPSHGVGPAVWSKKLREAAVWGDDPRRGNPRGDMLIFIHGYNNSQEVVMRRHRRLNSDLRAAGFKGVLMSFDWPSADSALNYLEDRHDAKRTAMQLVTGGIRLLSKQQTMDCSINIHLIGHSTGVYVIREAFDDADDATLVNSAWIVSQVVFIGGDVSSASLAGSSDSSQALYRHTVRLTNYSNRYDAVLKLSNAKRVGMAPRVGRVGLPENGPTKAVNVDCSAYFAKLKADPVVQQNDQREKIGTFEHSWHIGNRVFTQDLVETLKGDIDRQAIVTRQVGDDGVLMLRV